MALKDLEWRRNAARMVILIADAPPHGKCEAMRSGDRADTLTAQVSASGGTVSNGHLIRLLSSDLVHRDQNRRSRGA